MRGYKQGAQTPNVRLCGQRIGLPRVSFPCPRRRTLTASPHSVGSQSHARLFALLLLCALSALGPAPSRAQTAPAAPIIAGPIIAGPPEVLVMVYQQPGGMDQVNITYARLVPHAQVSADIDTLTKLSGWPISSRRIKDAAAPVQSRTGKMTSVTFAVPGVVQDSAHTFPVEVLARTFQRYKRMNAVFFAGPLFQFQGARSYADNDIKVSLDQHGAVYAYQVEVLTPNFSRLPPAAGGRTAASAARPRSPWVILAAIAGAALAAGLLVYVFAVRLTAPKPAPAPGETNAEARLEAETRK